MVGIPARVASGFAPGSYNRDTGEYRVRDLDAHSWVEVNLNGIGWVTFDPTPAAAPARREGSGTGAGAILGAQLRDRGGGGGGGAGASRTSEHVPAPNGKGGSTPWWPFALGLAGAALGLAAWWRRRAAADRPRGPEQELVVALRRLGWSVPEGTTLLALERRLARVAGPEAARYTARLRSHRYAPDAPPPPDRVDRRALRRALARPGGLRAWARSLLALPPAPFSRL
jgi:hypothetical protein